MLRLRDLPRALLLSGVARMWPLRPKAVSLSSALSDEGRVVLTGLDHLVCLRISLVEQTGIGTVLHLQFVLHSRGLRRQELTCFGLCVLLDQRNFRY